MRIPTWIATLCLALVLGTTSIFSAVPTENAQAARIAQLISQLGSEQYAEREAAARALDTIGPPAVEALRKAAASDDPEIRRRAQALVGQIEKRSEAARLLAPKRVRLVYQDTPVAQAVKDFAEKTGFAIQLQGDTSKLAGRTVTLDTGETTFWDAFDQFCRKAGLCERRAVTSGGNDAQAAVNAAHLKVLEARDAFNRAVQAKAAPAHIAQLQAALAQAEAEFARRQAQAQLLQLQIQRQRQIRVMRDVRHATPSVQDNRLYLSDGPPPVLPSCRAGAIRIRALPAAPVAKGQAETQFTLEVTPEPGLACQGIVDVQLLKAVDEHGQTLTAPAPRLTAPPAFDDTIWLKNLAEDLAEDDGSSPLPRQMPIRLQVGQKPSKVLAKVQGKLALRIQTPVQALLTVDRVLEAAGQTVEGAGRSLKVLEVKKLNGGLIQVHMQMDLAPDAEDRMVGRINFNRGGRALIVMAQAGNGEAAVSANTLALLDAEGKSFQLIGRTLTQTIVNPNGSMRMQSQLTFKPQTGQGDPARLVLNGRRVVCLEVPFTLEDVPLP